MLLKALSNSLSAVLAFSALAAHGNQGTVEDAASHHRAGVEYHLRRCLADASREYDRALALDPPREPNVQEWQIIRRFAPRIYVTRSEPFPLKEFAAILRTTNRLIADHLFWEDDL